MTNDERKQMEYLEQQVKELEELADALQDDRRERIATAFAAQLCAGPGAHTVANRDERYDETNWKEVVAMNAVEFADALIAELDKEPSK